MEYIQCTHCGKRYSVSDQIREAEGQFTTCQSCKEKFLMVIHDQEAKKIEIDDDSVISTGGWDPSLTMPTNDKAVESELDPASQEQFLDDDDDGAHVLATLQAARKRKQYLYALSGLTVSVLLFALWATLMSEDPVVQPSVESMSQKAKALAESAKVQDANNPECKQAAAQQWLIDYKAMHADYTGSEFLRILKLSNQQTEKVEAACKTPTIIKDIISAATAKEKPDWFKAELQAIQANSKH